MATIRPLSWNGLSIRWKPSSPISISPLSLRCNVRIILMIIHIVKAGCRYALLSSIALPQLSGLLDKGLCYLHAYRGIGSYLSQSGASTKKYPARSSVPRLGPSLCHLSLRTGRMPSCIRWRCRAKPRRTGSACGTSARRVHLGVPCPLPPKTARPTVTVLALQAAPSQRTFCLVAPWGRICTPFA